MTHGASDNKAGPQPTYCRERKTLETNVSNNDELSAITVDTTAYRQLIQQFYESSIQRYGADSEQTQMLKLHLAAHAGEAA